MAERNFLNANGDVDLNCPEVINWIAMMRAAVATLGEAGLLTGIPEIDVQMAHDHVQGRYLELIDNKTEWAKAVRAQIEAKVYVLIREEAGLTCLPEDYRAAGMPVPNL